MSLRDKPYLPLYIQDFMTDEKLAQCSAKATGVYIRLMCLMHKSDQYGKILLKQKFKQTNDKVKNFASQIVKHMPYDFHTVTESLVELIDEKVLSIDGDILIQKRMVEDNAISETRAAAGKKGGQATTLKTKDFAQANAKAKPVANTDIDIEDENGFKKGGAGENNDLVIPGMLAAWKHSFPKAFINIQDDYTELLEIAKKIKTWLDLDGDLVTQVNAKKIKDKWQEIVNHLAKDNFLYKYSLVQVNSKFPSIIQSFNQDGKQINGHSEKKSGLGNKSGGFGILNEALGKS